MSVPTSEHKVYMYTDDYNTVCTEVHHHQRIQTGGNLFGFWKSSGDAVINVVLGPGQECKRNTTSFFHDIEYLKRVGRFVNEEYMLCHIGEWRSHHSLILNQPSLGDEETIRRDFPQGKSKFLLIIANILKGGDRIVLSPYFFTHGGTRYEKAELKVLEANSPYSSDVRIVKQIKLGAEKKGLQRNEGTSSRANPRNLAANHKRSTSRTHSQAAQGSTHVNPSAFDSKADRNASRSNTAENQGEPMDTSIPFVFQHPQPGEGPFISASQSVASPSRPSSRTAQNQNTMLHPPIDNKRLSASPPVASPRNQTASYIVPAPKDYKRSISSPGNTTSGQAAPNQNEDKVDDTEILLKKIYNELKKWFGSNPEAKFEFKSSANQASGSPVIDIKFKHNDRYWMVRFPGNFPVAPAKLFCDGLESWLERSECADYYIVKPLTSHINILLSIKKRCMSSCKICKNISNESLAKSATAYDLE